MWKLGYEEIDVYWEQEELDWDLYEICVQWCIDGKILNNKAYKKKWIEKCQLAYRELEKERKKI